LPGYGPRRRRKQQDGEYAARERPSRH
jgi:hypothetical protein